MFYLYQIRNLVNGKKYVGVTDNPAMRWWAHRSRAKKLDQHVLARAIRKHGESNFAFEVMNSAETREDIYGLERFYISLLRSDHRGVGYNMTAGGMGGSQHPLYVQNMSAAIKALAADPIRGPAWRKKLSEGVSRAYANNPEYRASIAALGRRHKGMKRSAETRERISQVAVMRPPKSEDTRRKMSESMKGKNSYPRSDEIKERMRKASRLRVTDPVVIRSMSNAQKNSPRARASIADPGRRKRHSEFMKQYHAKKKLSA